MPNYCDFQMIVRGSKESINELIDILEYRHPLYSFYRVLDSYVYEEGEGYACICGDVAWSVNSTLLDQSAKNVNHRNSTLTTLDKESARLNLCCEIFSSEPGIGFQEHYIIKDGQILTEECVDYSEYWFEDSMWDGDDVNERFKNFCEYYILDGYSIDDLSDDKVITTGGFENFGVWAS